MSSDGGDKRKSGRPGNRPNQGSRRGGTPGKRQASGKRPARGPSSRSDSRRTGPPKQNTQHASAQSKSPRPAQTRKAVLPAAPPAAKPFATDPQTQALTLAAWDLARTRTKKPETSRGQIMTLRTHQKLVASFEDERGINDTDRSFLRVKEEAKGSCLFIHGVSTGPGDLRDLAEEFFSAGFNVYVLRLPDYGTPENTLSETTWESALNQAQQCFQLLARGGERVHVVGLGFGATLALHVALREKVSSLVLLAPAIMPRESLLQRLLVRLKLHHLKIVHRWMGWNADLMEGMDRARSKISKIKVPIYAAQCEDDDRACPGSLRFLQRKAGNKASRFQVFPEGGHTILEAHGPTVLHKEVLKFCRAR